MFTVPKSLAALLSVCSMVGPLSANTYMPGLTAIGQEFAVSEVATYQTLSGYLMTFALSSLFVGAVSDSIGRRAVMIGGMLFYALSCAICALSPSFEVSLGGRICMGIFASAGTVLAMAITRDLFEGQQAQEMTSLIAIIFALAPAFAPIIGGWLVLLWGWRSVFYFLAFFAFSMAVVCFFFLKETHPKSLRTTFHVFPLIRHYAHAMTNKAFAAGVVCNGFVFMGSILFSAGRTRCFRAAKFTPSAKEAALPPHPVGRQTGLAWYLNDVCFLPTSRVLCGWRARGEVRERRPFYSVKQAMRWPRLPLTLGRNKRRPIHSFGIQPRKRRRFAKR